jgi:KUP system potassium uptake protein
MKEAFSPDYGIPLNKDSVLGMLSLITWSMVWVIALKYLVVMMRADNNGEGGILALMALVQPRGEVRPRTRGWAVVLLGLFGASLLYGDGVLTPAISVLSAVEGLEHAVPGVQPYVVPITVGILVGLFAVQARGTASVGAMFGPVMLLWFTSLGLLGLGGIVRHPAVLGAVFPWHAIRFLADGGWHGFLVLGSVFLVATGGEALYADMGHFGRRPIQQAWFGIVLPGLLLNYFGQGALLLDGGDVEHPFFDLAPHALLIPLVLLATAATVIASQALISGVFSLTKQAIQLGYSPRLEIEHTSAREIGQIYVKQINWALFVGCVAVVIGFGSASALASAYGIAVSTTMVITTLLAFLVSRTKWGWSLSRALVGWSVFLVVELAFWVANMTKVQDGGWFPLLMGLGVFTLMTTWSRGRMLLAAALREQSVTLSDFRAEVEGEALNRVDGTAVFMTADSERIPMAMQRNAKANHVLHDHNVFVTVSTEQVPYASQDRRLHVTDLGDGFWRVKLRYGFMEEPDVPVALAWCATIGLKAPLDQLTYFLGRETVIASPKEGMAIWREQLFSVMATNAQPATAFFRIPTSQVIEIGAQIEI